MCAGCRGVGWWCGCDHGATTSAAGDEILPIGCAAMPVGWRKGLEDRADNACDMTAATGVAATDGICSNRRGAGGDVEPRACGEAEPRVAGGRRGLLLDAEEATGRWPCAKFLLGESDSRFNSGFKE